MDRRSPARHFWFAVMQLTAPLYKLGHQLQRPMSYAHVKWLNAHCWFIHREGVKVHDFEVSP
jgi:hypothetical protein